MLMKALPCQKREQGVAMLEALISILIFSIGILGLIGMQATAIGASTDAKNRANAAMLANSLIGRLAVSDPTTAAAYAHRPNGPVCAPTGSDSTDSNVTDWLRDVSSTLPGAVSNKQQIIVDTSNNLVTVAICWQLPNGDMHQHVVTTQMQWQ
jgi:type IV pilus assembly protein PilV